MSESIPLDRAVTALATLGAVFWSIQLIPQILLNWRRRSSDGLQPSMMILWALAGLPLGVHNIVSNQSIALQVQAQILTGLSLVTWSQVMFYDHHWTLRKCIITLAGLFLLFGSTEAALVVGFKYGIHDEQALSRAILAMAILAGVGLCLGVSRHYYDIYVHRTVRGMSWGFVGLDAAGDLTSLLAVTIRPPADRVAAAIYASELALWIGIMAAGVIYNLRFYIKGRLGGGDVHNSTTTTVRPTQGSPFQPSSLDSNDTNTATRHDTSIIEFPSLSRQSSAFSSIRPERSLSAITMRMRRRVVGV